MPSNRWMLAGQPIVHTQGMIKADPNRQAELAKSDIIKLYQDLARRSEELSRQGLNSELPLTLGNSRNFFYSLDTDELYIDSDGWQRVGSPKVPVAGGRLTLTSSTPVTTADVTGTSTMYYTPYKHSWISLLDTGNKNMLLRHTADITPESGNTFYSSVGGATLSTVATPWNGEFSLQAVTPGAVASEGMQTNYIGVLPNTSYAASAYVQASTGTPGLSFYIAWYTSAAVFISATSTAGNTIGTDWSRLSVVATSPATAAYARIVIVTTVGGAPQAITFRLDGVQLEQSAVVTPWSPGRTWRTVKFAQKSVTLVGATSGKGYDVFGRLSGDDLTLSILAWTNATTRASALAVVDGVNVLSIDHTYRLLGSFYCNVNDKTDDSRANRLVWNVDNRVQRAIERTDSTAHQYGNAAWRNWNNSATHNVATFRGLAEEPVNLTLNTACNADAGVSYEVGLNIGATPGTAMLITLGAPNTGPWDTSLGGAATAGVSLGFAAYYVNERSSGVDSYFNWYRLYGHINA